MARFMPALNSSNIHYFYDAHIVQILGLKVKSIFCERIIKKEKELKL